MSPAPATITAPTASEARWAASNTKRRGSAWSREPERRASSAGSRRRVLERGATPSVVRPFVGSRSAARRARKTNASAPAGAAAGVGRARGMRPRPPA